METKDLAWKVVQRANKLAPNSNFQIQGFDQAKKMCLVQALIETLNENGLLSGCLLCKNTNKEKEKQS